MPDPTPHVENTKIASGDRAAPVITDLTKGGKADSRIWHTKENDKFFEYRQKHVTKKAANLVCIAFTLPSIKCPAKLQVQPLAPNLILTKKGKRQNILSINYEAPLNHADWYVVPNSGTDDHSEYCINQVKRRDRIYDQNVINILDNYYKMSYPTQIQELVSTCLKIGSINKMISNTNNFISAQTENQTETE